MKFVKTIFAVLALTLLGATLVPGAHADEWNKKTVLTFSQPMEIPGQILPAGTYTFVLLDSPSDRHIVQIFNADGSHSSPPSWQSTIIASNRPATPSSSSQSDRATTRKLSRLGFIPAITSARNLFIPSSAPSN